MASESKHGPRASAARSLLTATLFVTLSLLGCAPAAVWPEQSLHGDPALPAALPSTLFVDPIDASAPCAGSYLSTAMGISRRGYYVLATPPGVTQAYRVEIRCSEHRAPVAILPPPSPGTPPSVDCQAPGVLHVEIEATLVGPQGERSGPLLFRGRQRVFPGPPGQECQHALEAEAKLRRRAGDTVGWRFPPGRVEQPGADPRILRTTP